MTTKDEGARLEIKVGKGTITFRWFVSAAFVVNLIVHYNSNSNVNEKLDAQSSIITNTNATVNQMQFQITEYEKDVSRIESAQEKLAGELTEFKDRFTVIGAPYNHIKGIQ